VKPNSRNRARFFYKESLICVSAAIRVRQRLRFGYQSHVGISSQREIEPFGVAHLDGRLIATPTPKARFFPEYGKNARQLRALHGGSGVISLFPPST
jgi:hypothetical protein